MMTISSIKRESREKLKGKWLVIAMILYIYSMLLGIGTSIAMTLSEWLPQFTLYEYKVENKVLFSCNWFSLISLLDIVTAAVLSVGVYTIYIKTANGEQCQLGDLFKGAKYWVKALGIIALTFVYTLLWSCLLIIPGIIKYYSYSMALFIYAQNPEKGVKQCIEESKQIMKGNKKKLFRLNLSFFGYVLLLYVVITLPFVAMMFGDTLVFIASLLFSLLVIFAGTYLLLSYMYVAEAVFYLDITNQYEY